MSRKIEDLTPECQAKCKEFLEACIQAGHPMLVVQTYRSFEEQELLYAKGRSLLGPVVTNAHAGDSFHNYRMAWDCCFSVHGGISWEGPWKLIGTIAYDLGITWGGNFIHFVDLPHFEYHPNLTLVDLKARTFIPKVV